MSGVQRFIQQRLQERPASPRQVLGSQLRVPVAPTRLARNNSKPPASKRNLDTTAAAPPQKQDSHALASSNVEYRHDDAFDTDAEGLDDTTVTSIGDSSRSHQHDMQASSHLPDGFTGVQNHRYYPGRGFERNEYEQRPIDRRMDQLEAEDATMEDGTESPNESVEEGDDGNGEGSGEEYEVVYVQQQQPSSPDEAVMRKISLDFAGDRNLEAAGFKQSMFQELTASPSMRNMSFRTPPKSSHRRFNAFPPPSHNTKGNVADTTVNQNQSTQHFNGIKRSETPVLLKASKEMTSGPHQRDQLVAPNGGEQPPPMPLAQTLQGGLENEPAFTNGRAMVNTNSSGRKMSPPAAHKQKVAVNGQTEIVEDMPPSNGDHWTAASTQNDEPDIPLPSQRKEDLNEPDDHQSTASIENPKCLKRSRDIDYSLDELSSMTFSQLQDEPFHHDPKATKPPLPPEIADAPLPQKLDYILSLKDDPGNNKQHHRALFFSSLPIEQYDDCGDLIVQKFADIVSKFKDARQQRRKVAREFEAEVTKREARVRAKMGAVEKDLGRLRRGGEEVVRGKLGM